MRLLTLVSIVVVALAEAPGGQTMTSTADAEKAKIKTVIENSIGWAATKDTAVLYRCFAQAPELFYFSPDDNGTISGFEAFKVLTESFFLRDEFQAVRYEIRDLDITVSRSGDVAWYHARLDDLNLWKGQPANWEDVRWTGVLEKRDGAWVIVQMHFSESSGK